MNKRTLLTILEVTALCFIVAYSYSVKTSVEVPKVTLPDSEIKVANDRYKSKCYLLNGQILVGLQLRLKLPNVEGLNLLEDGTVVCNNYGETAIIKYGYADKIARTNDHEIVASVFK